MISAKKFEIQENESVQKDVWNNQLKKCCNQNVFSLYEWGEFKKVGWQVERICFYNETTYVGQSQILFKKVGPFRLGWCSSGINLTDYRYLDEVIQALCQVYDFKRNYIRFNFLDMASGETSFTFDEVSALKAVKKTVNSGYTMRFFKLSQANIEAKNYTKNNRYYLKKSLESDLKFSLGEVDIKLFCDLHNSMAENKGIDHLKITEESIATLQAQYGPLMKMGLVKLEDKPLAACLILHFNKIAYYYLAGGSEEGRKLSASFFMVDSLLKELKALGVEEFDFGGLSPFKAEVAGVNRFKMGFAGTVVRYIGERNLCESKWLMLIFDFLIAKKIG